MQPRDALQSVDHVPFHLGLGRRRRLNTVPPFCGPPALLDVIQLAMVFWIEKSDVAEGFDVFDKRGFNVCEVGLFEKESTRAAVGLA